MAAKLALLEELLVKFELQWESCYTKLEGRPVQEVEFRLKVVSPMYEIMDENYDAFKRSKVDDEEKIARADELYKSLADRIPLLYGTMSQYIDENKQVPPVIEPNKPRSKLPTLPQPMFDGDMGKWLSFRDSFEAIIHKSTSLTTSEKYQYLRKALESIKNNVLRNQLEGDDYYEEAWKSVKERYDDPRQLKTQHFNDLLTIKSMSSDTPEEVRRILDDFSCHIKVLKQLKATFDDVLVHVVQYRMDAQTLKEWLLHLDDKEPSWELLSEYLTAQWRRLIRAHQPQRPSAKKVSHPVSNENVLQKSKPTKTFISSDRLSSSSEIKCALCKEKHGLFYCDKFRAMSVADRRNFVYGNKLCLNCLSSGHMVASCESKYRCRTCNSRHNTLLHEERSNTNKSSGFKQS